MLYGAMFDEVDEGKAMFKLAPSPADMPRGQWFLPLDADGCSSPGDYYLRLAGAATAALRAGHPPPAAMPAGPAP